MEKKNFLPYIILAIVVLGYYEFVLPMFEDVIYEKKPASQSSGNSTTGRGNRSVQAERSESMTAQNAEELPSEIQGALPEKPQPSEKTEDILDSYKNGQLEDGVEENNDIIIETNIFRAVFSNRGGTLQRLELKEYHPTTAEKDNLPLIEDPCFETSTSEKLWLFRHSISPDGLTITFTYGNLNKIYSFEPKSYTFSYELKDGDQVSEVDLNLRPIRRTDVGMGRTYGAVYGLNSRDYGDNSSIYTPENFAEDPILERLPYGDLQWAGFRDTYFTVFAVPELRTEDKPKEEESMLNIQPADGRHRVLSMHARGGKPELSLRAPEDASAKYKIFAGPLHKKTLYAEFKGKEEQMKPFFNYTGFDFIIHFLLWVLSLFHSVGFNMGFSILLLTLSVRTVLFPFNLKAQVSMLKMSELQPDIKELKEKYKNDQQQMSMEQMKLFRERGVNPLAGCLPMFIQMPVFISLFSAIGEGFQLRHAEFLGWIQDLSSPDRFAVVDLGFTFPFLGNQDGTFNINLLVFLYAITLGIQQSLMPKNKDPQQQQAQKMMKIMLYSFAIILYNYSSGLMLYFIGSNCLGIVESLTIRKKILPRVKEELRKKSKGKK